MAVSEDLLNHRQRKHVYMHSTIFDAEGPTTRSVYAQGRQHDVYDSLQSKLRRNNMSAPSMDLPSARDMVATHQAGHGVVMPSSHTHHQPIAGSSPRTNGKEYLAAEGDPIRVVRATNHKGKEEHITREFWQTSVNLQWHDTRTELSRQKCNTVMDSKDKKLQELSSEVLGKERMLEASTHAPRQELLAETAHIMEKDSSLDLRTQPRGGYPDADQRARRASDRFHNNLWHSPQNTMTESTRPEVAPAPLDEDPSSLPRRRQEKNFSDLFGTQMGERTQDNRRHDITGSAKCSFLDIRSEVAARKESGWNSQEVPHYRRKEAERHSDLFERDTPTRPDMEHDHRQVHRHERGCWDTRDLLNSGSEIARRVRLRDHHNEDAGVRQSAYDRKQDDLASGQVRMGMGIDRERVQQTSPRGSPRTREKQERLAVSARDMKIAALQSSIFT